MGDTMEETEPLPTRLNKPQTLDVDVLTENISSSSSSSVATGDDCKLLVTRDSTETATETENGARLVRNRTRTFTETRDCRDHSSDGLITTSSSDGQLGSGKCTEDTACNNDLTRRESFNSGDTSPSTTNNFAKNLFSRSMRYSSSGCATTTKKCVLTLDGYSYVIVASQPESFVKRSEEPTGTTSSVTSSTAVSNTSTSSSGAINSGACGNAVSGNIPTSTYAASITTSAGTGAGAGAGQGQGVTTESATSSPNSNCKANPTFYTGLTNTGSSATINGQVATHGSLTIVRRSNSRKNFGQVDGQQYASGTTPLTPTSTTIPAGLTNLQQQQQSQQTSNSNLSDGIASGVNTQDNHLKTTRIYQGTTTITTTAIATNPDKDSVTTQEVTQREELGTKNTNKQENNQSNMEQIQPINPPTTPDPCMHPASPNDQVPLIPAPFDNCADVENTDNIIELGIDNLPAVDTPDACDKAALRLRCILKKISRGDVNNDILRTNLHYAARVLEAVFNEEAKRLADEDDELSEVQPDAVPLEVREWLASTFTRQLATTRRSNDEKPKFRSVAHAIRAGIFVDRIYRRVSSTSLMQFPPEVVKVLKNINDWSFNVFQLAEVSNNQPIKYLCYDLFNRYGLTHKYKIAPATMETFLHRIEEGYCRYRNPYHNNLHGADVTQAVHFILCQLGVMNWLTDLEIFASLFAALIHDYEHTGTTNNFHVMTGSDTALLYNDRCVLENHHVSAAFRLLKDDDANILSHLSREEFRELRTLIIEMVLATDMSGHFQQLKNMRNLLSLNETTIEKSKALSMVLHCCDISHPAKAWNIHHRWTMLLLEEFFRQGDLESQMGLPFSPLCDRKTTHIPESQIGFIDFIVDPSMALLGEMLEQILAPIAPMIKNSNQTQSQSVDIADDQTQAQASPSKLRSSMRQTVETIQESTDESSSRKSANKKFTVQKPWMDFMAENKTNWKVLADKEQKERDAAEQKEREMAGAEEKHDDNDEKEVDVKKCVEEEKSDEKGNKDQEPETETVTETETETKGETAAEE